MFVRCYVHLARGFDVDVWHRKWRAGEIIGINEESPYGYHRARAYDVRLFFSQDSIESSLGRIVRLGLRAVLGFDFAHSWRNRSAIAESQVVWTHTESQHLAVAAVMLILERTGRIVPECAPKLISQSIWLFDNWYKMSWIRRKFYTALIRRADVLTVHSSSNLKLARQIFPAKRVELIPFGISVDLCRAPNIVGRRAAVNILAVGNDRHRDWSTLVSAVESARVPFRLNIVSATIDRKLAARSGVVICRPKSNAELYDLYKWADLAVVPLVENYHASGITALQEAVVFGLPVVATDTGGLRDYFNDEEVVYVAPGDSRALREAITQLAVDPETRHRLASSAQRRLGSPGYSSESFVHRHVVLSRELLNGQ